jgi:antitoxin component of MazEF toxin-antitoxin module
VKELPGGANMESEDRKLIKFSNYSLCVTLPKWIIKKLKWNKGDIVKMVVNEEKGEILIKKGTKVNSIQSPIKTAKTSEATGKKARW